MFSRRHLSLLSLANSGTLSRRSTKWCAGATCAAAAIGLVATTAPAQAATRHISGSASFVINDYEDFGSDERCNHDVNIDFTLTTGQTRSRVATARCGGEIRAELRYTVREENGTVYLTKGRVDFFEGDSENTNDLDGTKRLAPDNMAPGESLTYKPFVYNRDENETRDWARVEFTLSNG